MWKALHHTFIASTADELPLHLREATRKCSLRLTV